MWACRIAVDPFSGLQQARLYLELLELLEALSPGSERQCDACGQQRPALFELPVVPYRPWRMRGLAEMATYVETLPLETREWLLAFYVDDECGLLSAETLTRGGVSEVRANMGQIICRGRALLAAGFVLVHNHPSGDPTPSAADVAFTVRAAQTARECEMPMLTHVIVASGGMRTVGNW